jgi:glycosyltransferase involved in cell wall biosynthesis
MKKLTISIIIPVYSGENYLRKLIEETDKVKNEWEQNSTPFNICEVIFVNDSAIDKSKEIIFEITQKYDWVKNLSLSKNFGKHQATVAGILHSTGDWVVTMDETLKHHPANLKDMLIKVITQSDDIIYGIPNSNKNSNKDETFINRITSRFLKWFLYNTKFRNFSSFRISRGPIARAAAAVCQHESYFDVVLSWFTIKQTSLNLSINSNEKIINNKSHIGVLTQLRRLLTSSHSKLLRIGSIIGILSMAVSLISSGWIIYSKVSGNILISGWTSTIITYLFLGGLTLFLLGILLEYISIILLQLQGKPTFFIIDRNDDDIIKNYLQKN